MVHSIHFTNSVLAGVQALLLLNGVVSARHSEKCKHHSSLPVLVMLLSWSVFPDIGDSSCMTALICFCHPQHKSSLGDFVWAFLVRRTKLLAALWLFFFRIMSRLIDCADLLRTFMDIAEQWILASTYSPPKFKHAWWSGWVTSSGRVLATSLQA